MNSGSGDFSPIRRRRGLLRGDAVVKCFLFFLSCSISSTVSTEYSSSSTCSSTHEPSTVVRGAALGIVIPGGDDVIALVNRNSDHYHGLVLEM